MGMLKLGPLPDDKPIKLSITVTGELVALLKAYAEAVGSADGGAVNVERLIPPIVERFIRSDRAFMKARRRPPAARSITRSVPVPVTSAGSNS